MNDPMASLALRVHRFRWFVLGAWIVLLLALAPRFAPTAADYLKSGGLEIDQTESQKADKLLGDEFQMASQSSLVVLFHSSTATVDDAGFQSAVTDAAGTARGVDGVTKVTTFYDAQLASLVSGDRHAMLMPIAANGDQTALENLVRKLRSKLAGISLEHYVLGGPAAAVDGQTAAQEDLHRAEFVTLPIIVVMLLIVFRTVLAAVVPLLLGLFSVAFTTVLLGILGRFMDVSIFALNVGSLIGLGLSIDYSLIILTRYREEMAAGHPPDRALAITMANAGRSILYSAITVMLAMGAITAILWPIMVVRSISLAVLLVAVLLVILANTLLPALMAILNRRLEWLRVIPRGRGPKRGEVGIWYRFSHFVMARPWVFLALCLVVLLGLAAPVATIAFGSPAPPKGTEVATGTTLAHTAYAPGQLAPIYVVIRTPAQDGVWTPDVLMGVRQLSTNLAADSRVSSVSSLSTALASLPDAQFSSLTPSSLGPLQPAAAAFVNLTRNDDTTIVTVVSKYADNDARTTQLVKDMRASTVPAVTKLSTAAVYVGGQTAVIADFSTGLFDRFPMIAVAIALIILVILMMFFQSVALPVKAMIMNLVSIAATFGILSLIFQHGLGSGLFQFDSTSYITVITPGILYVILFALSTDYEVFMLARVKEYFQLTGNNEEAVATGLQHTAGIITAAGLILVLTFGSFVVSNTVVLKELGLGLALGVLLDSSIVRVVMVPATMRLLGPRNWWMPAWLKRIVPEISEGGARELADYTEAAPAPPGAVGAPALVAAAVPAVAAAAAPGVAAGTLTTVMPALPSGLETVAVPVQPAEPARPAVPARAPLTSASLLVSGTWDGIPVIPLPTDRPTRFGRMDSNEIHLPSLAVSRWHARIDYVDGQFVITDLNSLNGVYVNHVRIPPRPQSTELRPGDHLVIGGYTNVAFTLRGS